MKFEIMILICCWIMIANGLLDNFDKEIQELPLWRSVLLEFVLVLGAPIFFIEELLEIVIDEIIGEE